ncbi:NAD-P-binding protein [Polyporus arcularius HHB13444]|uniref:NAD-P-binding protein n=1 Tax=Polyporus arcularius HHB13444 TaxID=1314778 RepID=A0A5C3PPA6_9APHY|nr:NAD-P-binding protein [Polyporus arcularius HHB13444]
MASKTPIFLTGATGYIGGAVLARLLNHPNASTFAITALVRNAEKAKVLESKFGVKAVVGNHEEFDKVESLAENAHVVFNLAEADNVPFIKAVLSGLRKRHAKHGDLPILIHTSGTGLLADDARGEYATDVIYDDLNVEQYKAIPDTALHRNVDLLVINADVEGYARTYIVPPSTIYGIAKHPLVDAGVANPHSIQIPTIIEACLARKQAGVVGKGKGIWPDVHIDDIADLYIVLYDAIVANPEKVGHGWEGIFFGENGEHSWYQISKAIGEAMVALGISTDPEPTSFTTEEMVKYFGSEQWGWYCSSNSRCRGNRPRALGWKPKYTTEDMLKSIQTEVEEILKKPPRQPPFWPGIPAEKH